MASIQALQGGQSVMEFFRNQVFVPNVGQININRHHNVS